MAGKTKKRRRTEGAQLEMTPMIDVVFQLLIFFLVTLKQEDILSHLDVSRPAPDPNAKPEEQVDLLTIQVYNHKALGGEGIVLKGRKVSRRELERQLTRLASYSKNLSVVIKCTADSPHGNLVKVLDVCAKAGLENLSVFSM
jgi:biopolymer transport protein ExbD